MMAPGSRDWPSNAPPPDWPAPDTASLARSRELAARIRAEIDASGPIPFDRYMELALYATGLGYYAAANEKFGEGGDYITAPMLSPLFAQCVARQVADLLAALGDAEVLEAGAGNGVLAAELLRELEAVGRLPRRYCILELSAELRARQQQTLAERAAHLLPRVEWLDTLPREFRGVILGNEVLDAMPVARFEIAQAGVNELCVGYDDRGFAYEPRPARESVRAAVASLGLPAGYVSELGLQAQAWVRSLAERLTQGALLLFDYGFPRSEFYHPQRDRGTLMCHYRHRAHDDPFMLVGLQDITAHVDFTGIAEAAHESGLDVLGYTSQAAFLIGCGLAELAAQPLADARAELLRAQVVNKLTAPHEMGELFKAIALGRGIEPPLRGFAVHDRRPRL